MQNSPLFQLLDALTPAEKAYFKRFALKQADPDSSAYLKLFAWLNSRQAPDEQAFAAKLKALGIKARPAAARNYLFNSLLRSLTEFHSNHTTEGKLLQHLREISLLRTKGIRSLVRKKIASARRLVHQGHFPELEAHLLNEERWAFPIQANTYPTRRQLLEKLADLLEERLNYVQYRMLLEEMLEEVHQRGWLLRSDADRAHIARKLQHPLLADESRAIGFLAKFNLAQTRVVYHLMLAEWDQALHWSRYRLSLFATHPQQKKLHPQNYLTALDNHLSLLVTADAFEEFDRTAAELERAIGSMQDHTERIVRTTDLLATRMNRLLKERRFEEAVALAHQLGSMSEVERYQPGMSTGRNFYIARALFFGQHYDQALDWLMRTRNDELLQAYPDFWFYLEALHWMTHYHLGHTWLLDSLLRSLQRLLAKLNRYSEVDKIAVQFFAQLMNLPPGQPTRDAFKKFRQHLEPLRHHPLERLPFQYIDFALWAEKAAGTS